MQIPGENIDSSIQRRRVEGNCSYCGATLLAEYYFCPSCASPYKKVETVLSPLFVARPSDHELVRRTAPQVYPLFFTYMGVVLGMAVLSYALFGSTQRELAILLGSLAIFVTTCFFAVRYWPSLAVQFKQVGFNTAAAWIGLLLLAPLLAINYGYHSFIFKLAGHEVEAANDLHKLAISNVGLVILICVFPAILEEIAFRGLVQHWLTTAIGPAKAMLLASAMFTALHFSIISAPYLFMVGMLLAWTKWKSKSLYPCMLIHFLHNFVVIQYF